MKSRKPAGRLKGKSREDLAEEEWLSKELRYMSIENVANDFKSTRERRAIAAVLRWLSHNGICGWQTKYRHLYDTAWMAYGRIRHNDMKSQVVVLHMNVLRKAEKTFRIDRAKERARNRR